MSKKTVRFEIDAGELVDRRAWETPRNKIDNYGAKGIADGFGALTLKVNDQAILTTLLREDTRGQLVLSVYNDNGELALEIPVRED